ncbi:cytidine deaminase [Mesorhizobium sp. 8]|uniref:cytidine deaminase family protein n=1 Tax=Mesorhizobium sp. 8 TaxID=2584466 RepID=UPI001123400F|nr:cytidine deaminase [Mesorhizobium sp. 8]QDC02839.1 cytidine deaminase [Mesorhizobium sp. 8]
MANFDHRALQVTALKVAGDFICSEDLSAGGVASALVTASGSVHTGICIDTACSLGFCAEHAAIADMLKSRQTRIVAIVAMNADGAVMPPCGRCRELIRQVDPGNWHTAVVVAPDTVVTLAELLPFAAPVKPAVAG